MARRGKQYNLLNFKDGKYEITQGYAKEIKEFLNMPDLDVSNALDSERVFCGKYILQLAQKEIRKHERVKKRGTPMELYREWETVTSSLRKRITWVKKEDEQCHEKVLKLDLFTW